MDYNQAFATPLGGAPWEKKDNPCSYVADINAYISPESRRHQLGLVGGNEVSTIKGNIIDLESDLRGITRINTHAPWNKYQPSTTSNIKVTNWKTDLTINTAPKHLVEYQSIAYPAVYAPKPIVTEVCREPHKM